MGQLKKKQETNTGHPSMRKAIRPTIVGLEFKTTAKILHMVILIPIPIPMMYSIIWGF
jgi:hypothetical protein